MTWLRLPLVAVALLAAPLLPRIAGAQVAELQVTPDRLTLKLGEKRKLLPVAFDARGTILTSTRFAFASADTSVAAVGGDGTVEGRQPGLTTVRVSAGEQSYPVPVLVQAVAVAPPAAPVAAIVFPEPELQLVITESAQPVALAQLTDGTTRPLERARWSTPNPTLVAVDPNTGRLKALRPGSAAVQVTDGTVTGTLRVEISAELELSAVQVQLAVGDTTRLALLASAQRQRVARVPVTWTSLDSSVAVVDPTGLVRALAAGQTTIRVGGIEPEGAVRVSVHAAVREFVLTPAPEQGPLRVPLTGVRAVGFRVIGGDGAEIADARVAWQVGDTTIAQWEAPLRSVRGLRIGRTTLTATFGRQPPVTWQVEVVGGGLRADRERIVLRPGDGGRVSAVVLSEGGAPLELPSGAAAITWTSDRPDLVEVAPDGALRARAPGRAHLVAGTAWGAADTVTAFVVGDLLVGSNRDGAVGLYQLLLERPEQLLPLARILGRAVTQPARSPDRALVAAAATVDSGNVDVVVLDADGQNLRRLTTEPGTDTDPRWTPDGRQLVFISARVQGTPQLFAVGAEGGAARPLTSGRGGAASPDVAPDGQRVAFVSSRDGGPRLWEVRLDGTGLRRLTTGTDREGTPRWLPSGDLVYTVEAGGSRTRIVRLPAGATVPTLLVEVPARVAALAVSRDGRQLAYVTSRLAGSGAARVAASELFVRPLDAAPTVPSAPIFLKPGEQLAGVDW